MPRVVERTFARSMRTRWISSRIERPVASKYALFEGKTGGKRLIEEGAETLNALAKLIAVKALPPPAFRMILTAVGEYAYTRKEDGIIVCPLSALGCRGVEEEAVS